MKTLGQKEKLFFMRHFFICLTVFNFLSVMILSFIINGHFPIFFIKILSRSSAADLIVMCVPRLRFYNYYMLNVLGYVVNVVISAKHGFCGDCGNNSHCTMTQEE